MLISLLYSLSFSLLPSIQFRFRFPSFLSIIFRFLPFLYPLYLILCILSCYQHLFSVKLEKKVFSGIKSLFNEKLFCFCLCIYFSSSDFVLSSFFPHFFYICLMKMPFLLASVSKIHRPTNREKQNKKNLRTIRPYDYLNHLK